MGLFSSKRVHVTATDSNRLIADEYLTDGNKELLYTAINKNKDFMQLYRENSISGTYTNFKRMQAYGANAYTRGLPTAYLEGNSASTENIKTVLDSIEGLPVTIQYAHFSKLNAYHLAWKILTEDYGYNYVTNALDNFGLLSGVAFVNDLTYLVPGTEVSSSDLETLAWGEVMKGITPPNAITVVNNKVNIRPSPGITVPTIVVNYKFKNNENRYETRNLVLELGAYDFSLNLLQVKYLTGTGQMKYWEYNKADNTYPLLNPEINGEMTYISAGSYMPVALLRSEGVNALADKDSDLYKTTKHLLGIINVDVDSIVDSLEENEDIDQVRQAAIQFSIPVNSQNQLDMQYLFHYWDSFYERIQYHDGTVPGEVYEFQKKYMINFKEGTDYSYGVGFSNLQRSVKPGLKLPVGTYSNTEEVTFIRTPVTVWVDTYTDSETGEVTGIPSEDIYIDEEGRAGYWTTEVRPLATNARVYRYQVNEFMYQEVRVHEPFLRMNIHKGQQIVSDYTDKNCMIPIDMTVVETFKVTERTLLLQRSLHIVYNSYDYYTIEWYQRTAFKVFLVIVAIAITIFSGGTASGPVAAGLAALGVTGVALTILTLLIEMLIFNFLLEQLADYIPPELALALAVVAILIGATVDLSSVGITAANLLNYASGLIGLANIGYRNEAQRIQDDYEAEQQRQEELLDYLDEVQKQLEPAIDVNPFEFMGLRPLTIMGESPDSFYTRTIHSGNIGTVAYDMLHNYHSNKLKLPTASETLSKETFHV